MERGGNMELKNSPRLDLVMTNTRKLKTEELIKPFPTDDGGTCTSGWYADSRAATVTVLHERGVLTDGQAAALRVTSRFWPRLKEFVDANAPVSE